MSEAGLDNVERDDTNGKIVKGWLKEGCIILMNKEEICEGRYKFDIDRVSSAIDSMLANKNMRDQLNKIKINEKNK